MIPMGLHASESEEDPMENFSRGGGRNHIRPYKPRCICCGSCGRIWSVEIQQGFPSAGPASMSFREELTG